MKLLHRIHNRHLALLTAGIAIGAFVVAGPSAGAGTMAATTPVGHFSLAASAFAPDSLHHTTEDYYNAWDPSALSNQDTDRCFSAGAVLPPNATLKSFTAYYTRGSGDMLVEFNRQDLLNHTSVDLADLRSGTAAAQKYVHTTKNILTADAVVKPSTYAYSFGVCPKGTTTFSGLIITYSITTTTTTTTTIPKSTTTTTIPGY